MSPTKAPRPKPNPQDPLLPEIRAIITDQINRHVAAPDAHRAWLANDISQRVCALVDDRQRYMQSVISVLMDKAQREDEWLAEHGPAGNHEFFG